MAGCIKNTRAIDRVISPNSPTGSNGHIARSGATNNESNGDNTIVTLSDEEGNTKTGHTENKKTSYSNSVEVHAEVPKKYTRHKKNQQ